MNEIRFLQEKFLEYYEKAKLFEPSEIEKREFGFGIRKKIEIRHESFRSLSALKHYILLKKPLFISFSTSRYLFPSARPMEKKGWLGCDLVFDLDSPTEKARSFEEHLEFVKRDVIKLIDFLEELGLSKSEMIVNFSGNKGYHVRVESEKVRELSQEARREIVDYVSGRGIDADLVFGLEHGWGRRLREKLRKKIERFDSEFFLSVKGIKEKTLRKLEEKRESILRSLNERKIFLPLRKMARENLVKALVKELCVNVDPVVTLDTKRLIRLPESLHGETGLKAALVKNVERFDPLKHAVVFGSEPLKVFVEECGGFTLKDEEFGPFKRKLVELPEFAAIFLIAKGKAKLA